MYIRLPREVKDQIILTILKNHVFQEQYMKVKTLAVFRRNIYIINVLKLDKNYLTKV